MTDQQQPTPERIWLRGPLPIDLWLKMPVYSERQLHEADTEYVRVDLLPCPSVDEQRLVEIRERWANVPTMGVGIWEHGDSLYEEAEPHRTVGHLHGQVTRDTAIALSKSKTDIDYLLSLHCRCSSQCSECGRPAYLKGNAAEASKFIREMLEGEALTAIEPYLEDLERAASLLQQPPAASEQCPVTCAEFSMHDCKEPHQCVRDKGHPFDPMYQGQIHHFVTHMMPVQPRVFPATGATSEHEEAWITCAQCGKKRHVSTLAHGADTFVCRYCLSTDAAPAGATSQQPSLEDLAIQAANYLDEFNLIESKQLAYALRAHVKSCRATAPAATAEEEARKDHDDCSHWREGDSDRCVWCGDDLGPTTEADVARPATAAAPPVETQGHTAECDVWIYPDRPCTCRPSTTTPGDAAREAAVSVACDIVREHCATAAILDAEELIVKDEGALRKAIIDALLSFPPTASAPARVEALRSALNEIEAELISIKDGASPQEAVGKVFAIINSVRATPALAESGEVERLREALRAYRKIVKGWQSHVLITSRLLGCAAIDKDVESAIDKLKHDLAEARAKAIAECVEVAKKDVSERITIARTEKEHAEAGGYDRDALRLDGVLGVLENLLNDIEIVMESLAKGEGPADQ